MILGDTCTRGCRFCAVTTGNPRGAYDPREPEHTGRTIAAMGLDYVVITMVDRDDMLDGGAAHVAETLRPSARTARRSSSRRCSGDFQGSCATSPRWSSEGRPDVFAHNVETVDAAAAHGARRAVLAGALPRGARARQAVAPETYTKSSIMVGLGETLDEVLETMRALREVDVDVLTLGQYLRPTPKHHEVVRYVHARGVRHAPREGLAMGFRYVAAGPLVRSSYKAAEAFLKGMASSREGDGPCFETPAAPAVAAGGSLTDNRRSDGCDAVRTR
jgi:lipoic acid synthetase